MNEKFLPIGSVIRLKGASKKILIIGYFAVDVDNPQIVFTYSGCVYPEGFIGSQTILFNSDQIEEVYFKGYMDEEQQTFNKQLFEIEESITNNN